MAEAIRSLNAASLLPPGREPNWEEAEAVLKQLADGIARLPDGSGPLAARPRARETTGAAAGAGASMLRAELRKMEARYRTLVEKIPAVTFMAALDEGLNELYVSPQIETLLGFSQKEWLENPVLWYTQLHPDDRRRWHDEFARTCATGASFRSLYRFLARDGRVVWVQGEAVVVRDDDGRPLFLQGVAFDITAIKEAEEALRRAKADLEERVRERTEALARSMAELQQKTTELEDFAYHAVHDLLAPLRTMLVSTQRLVQESGAQLSEQARKRLDHTIRGVTDMRTLILKLREYEHVNRPHQVTAVECAEVVAEAYGNLQADVEDGGVQVLVGDLPAVSGVRPHLLLLFQNLISNAIKYRSRERPGRVEIGARRQGSAWLFWVRDNGIGIEPRWLHKLFLLGERLHGPREYEGWGYGLAICGKTVTQHGGRIWVASEPGRGSTFYFTLPAGSEAPLR